MPRQKLTHKPDTNLRIFPSFFFLVRVGCQEGGRDPLSPVPPAFLLLHALVFSQSAPVTRLACINHHQVAAIWSAVHDQITGSCFSFRVSLTLSLHLPPPTLPRCWCYVVVGCLLCISIPVPSVFSPFKQSNPKPHTHRPSALRYRIVLRILMPARTPTCSP